MVLFADLDRTLIWSHRNTPPGPFRWVEEFRGHHQSFMTEGTWTFLREQRDLEVIPLTTRTEAQYSRLAEAAAALGWRRALILNGAVLLEDGKENPDWREESQSLCTPSMKAFQEALRAAEAAAGTDAIVNCAPFLFYIKAPDPEETESFLRSCTDMQQLTVRRDARKVYCFHSCLEKGTALRRFAARCGLTRTMAAGDSGFDLSMLAAADTAFCPDSLAERVQQERDSRAGAAGKGAVCPCGGGIWSDGLCDRLKEYVRKQETASDCRQ